jgi:ABC-type branched-subunit amino acid transport system ATPase component
MRQRLRTATEVSAARKEVAAYKEFEQLCEQYVHVAETLAGAERETFASAEALKKGLKSRSSRARKSRG